MNGKMIVLLGFGAALLGGVTARLAGQSGNSAASISPAAMSRVGTIDERFQSYNI
jgi:hypothetical protein